MMTRSLHGPESGPLRRPTDTCVRWVATGPVLGGRGTLMSSVMVPKSALGPS